MTLIVSCVCHANENEMESPSLSSLYRRPSTHLPFPLLLILIPPTPFSISLSPLFNYLATPTKASNPQRKETKKTKKEKKSTKKKKKEPKFSNVLLFLHEPSCLKNLSSSLLEVSLTSCSYSSSFPSPSRHLSRLI